MKKLKDILPENILVPKSNQRYLNYYVENQEGNKITVITPHGLYEYFEIDGNVLRRYRGGKKNKAEKKGLFNILKSKKKKEEKKDEKLEKKDEKLEKIDKKIEKINEKTINLLKKELNYIKEEIEVKIENQNKEIKDRFQQIEEYLAKLEKETKKKEEYYNKKIKELEERITKLEKIIFQEDKEGKNIFEIKTQKYTPKRTFLPIFYLFILYLKKTYEYLKEKLSKNLKFRTISNYSTKIIIISIILIGIIIIPLIFVNKKDEKNNKKTENKLTLLNNKKEENNKKYKKYNTQNKIIRKINKNNNYYSYTEYKKEKKYKTKDNFEDNLSLGKEEKLPEISQAINLVEKSTNPDDKIEAARKLGKIGTPVAGKYLLKLLKDNDMTVRWEAIRALKNIKKYPPIYKELIKIAADKQENNSTRIEAINTLAQIGRKREARKLLKILLDKEDTEDVRGASAQAIAYIGFAEFCPQLLPMLDDSSPIVRRSVAEALGKFGYPKAVSKLINLLEDEDYDVRITAIKSLSNIHEKNAISKTIQGISKYLERNNYNIDSEIKKEIKNMLNILISYAKKEDKLKITIILNKLKTS